MNIISILSSNIYRISVLVLTLILAIFIFYVSLGHRKHVDFAADVKPITPELYTKWGQYSNLVDFGMYIKDFSVLSYSESKFGIEAQMWFIFDPTAISVATVQNFSFDAGRIIEKRLVDAKRIYEKLYLRYIVKCEFVSPLNYKYYPLDGHRVSLIMKLDEVAPWEVIIRSTYTRALFDEGAFPFTWKNVKSMEIEYGYFESNLDSRTADNIDFTPVSSCFFDMRRADLREAILIFVPLIVLLLIILGSLLMALTGMQSVIITFMGMIAMIMYRFIVTYMAPSPVVSYYMLSDYIFLLIFACALIVFIFEIINAFYKQEEEWWFDMNRGIALTLSGMVFLIGWVYFIYIW